MDTSQTAILVNNLLKPEETVITQCNAAQKSIKAQIETAESELKKIIKHHTSDDSATDPVNHILKDLSGKSKLASNLGLSTNFGKKLVLGPKAFGPTIDAIVTKHVKIYEKKHKAIKDSLRATLKPLYKTNADLMNNRTASTAKNSYNEDEQKLTQKLINDIAQDICEKAKKWGNVLFFGKLVKKLFDYLTKRTSTGESASWSTTGLDFKIDDNGAIGE